jgi:hypothetical protein
MKKYFAKYLPVEGKIKEGDWVMNTTSPGAYHKWEALSNVHEFTTTTKKVKLFLCSRDIKEGDTIFNINGGKSHIVKFISDNTYDVNYRYIDPGDLMGERYVCDCIPKDVCYKVIGEISPDALSYVKEGDEFDEEEVRIIWNFVGEDSIDELFTFEEWPNQVRKWYGGDSNRQFRKSLIECPPIAIKGPCGYFH